jgi:phospholipase/carboxylesterase
MGHGRVALVRFGELEAHLKGGPDREGGGPGPAVVLLHGFGAPGDDLVSLWRGLMVPHSVRFVFPVAPILLDRVYQDARAWWMVDYARMQRAMRGDLAELASYVPPGLVQARAQVLAVLDDVEEKLGVSGDEIVLGGFSQGANLAADIALVARRKLAGLVMLSGGILEEAAWVEGMGARPDLPVLISHGTRDEVLPYPLSQRLRDRFRENGIEPTWVSFNGGHEIPWSVTEELGPFLCRALDVALD